MKTTQLSCTPSIASAVQRNFAPMRCDGSHKHASLLGGRDGQTGAFPSRATATYTNDTCARLADAFVRSSPQLAATLSEQPISVPDRSPSPADAHIGVADCPVRPASPDPLADWAHALGISENTASPRGVDASAAHLFCAREDYVADQEERLDAGIQTSSAAAAPISPTTLTAGERDMVLNAIATVSSENISLDELKSLMQDDDAVLCMLRGAAPLNGQALRPDFLFDCGIDDSVFAGIVENFAGDTPSYRQAMAGSEYKLWESAFEKEIDNLLRNNTYEPVPEDSLASWCPRRGTAHEVIGTIAVLKRKRDGDN